MLGARSVSRVIFIVGKPVKQAPREVTDTQSAAQV
ncbi:hypothetical protein BURKHO8Y_540016 [Burkholderia sp. 8Y]|nr:hypothetical protein BURKHO8Y_540016 [Burkholderia sp. 8Y]